MDQSIYVTYNSEDGQELRNQKCIPNMLCKLIQLGSREGGNRKTHFPYDEPDKLYIWSDHYRGTLSVGQSAYMSSNIIEIMRPIYNNGAKFNKSWIVSIEYVNVQKNDINIKSRIITADSNGNGSSTCYNGGSICNILRLNHMFIKPNIELKPDEFLAFEITGIVFKCYVPILDYFNIGFYLDIVGKQQICKLGIGTNGQYDMDNMKVKLVKFNVTFSRLKFQYVKSNYEVEFRYYNIDMSNYRNNELIFAYHNLYNIAAFYPDNALGLIYPDCVNLNLNLTNGCENKKVNYNFPWTDLMDQFPFLYDM